MDKETEVTGVGVEQVLRYLNEQGRDAGEYADLEILRADQFSENDLTAALKALDEITSDSMAPWGILHILRCSDPSGALLMSGCATLLKSENEDAVDHVLRFSEHLPKRVSPEFCVAFAKRSAEYPWLWLTNPVTLRRIRKRCRS